MAFTSDEESVRLSEPCESYYFSWDGGFIALTNYHEDFIWEGITYRSCLIKRGGISANTITSKSDLILTLPFNDVAKDDLTVNQHTVWNLRIDRWQPPFTSSNNKIVVWTGRMIDATWKRNDLELRCESAYTSIKRSGLTRTLSQNCPYTLFSDQCGLNRGGFIHTYTITTSNYRNLITSNASQFDDNFFGGGYVEINIDGIFHRRSIISHVGNEVIVNYPFPEFEANKVGIFYTGCDRQFTTCRDKFDNVVNFGGFPYTPNKNPFNSTIY